MHQGLGVGIRVVRVGPDLAQEGVLFGERRDERRRVPQHLGPRVG